MNLYERKNRNRLKEKRMSYSLTCINRNSKANAIDLEPFEWIT